MTELPKEQLWFSFKQRLHAIKDVVIILPIIQNKKLLRTNAVSSAVLFCQQFKIEKNPNCSLSHKIKKRSKLLEKLPINSLFWLYLKKTKQNTTLQPLTSHNTTTVKHEFKHEET